MSDSIRTLPTAYGPGFVPIAHPATQKTSFDFNANDVVHSRCEITKTLIPPRVAIMLNSLVIIAVAVYSLFYLGCNPVSFI